MWDSLKTIGIGPTLVTIAVLIVLVFLIFRPAIESLQKKIDELKEQLVRLDVQREHEAKKLEEIKSKLSDAEKNAGELSTSMKIATEQIENATSKSREVLTEAERRRTEIIAEASSLKDNDKAMKALRTIATDPTLEARLSQIAEVQRRIESFERSEMNTFTFDFRVGFEAIWIDSIFFINPGKEVIHGMVDNGGAQGSSQMKRDGGDIGVRYEKLIPVGSEIIRAWATIYPLGDTPIDWPAIIDRDEKWIIFPQIRRHQFNEPTTGQRSVPGGSLKLGLVVRVAPDPAKIAFTSSIQR
jgi:chaperonin cofactor prefoldin